MHVSVGKDLDILKVCGDSCNNVFIVYLPYYRNVLVTLLMKRIHSVLNSAVQK